MRLQCISGIRTLLLPPQCHHHTCCTQNTPADLSASVLLCSALSVHLSWVRVRNTWNLWVHLPVRSTWREMHCVIKQKFKMSPILLLLGIESFLSLSPPQASLHIKHQCHFHRLIEWGTTVAVLLLAGTCCTDRHAYKGGRTELSTSIRLV